MRVSHSNLHDILAAPKLSENVRRCALQSNSHHNYAKIVNRLLVIFDDALDNLLVAAYNAANVLHARDPEGDLYNVNGHIYALRLAGL